MTHPDYKPSEVLLLETEQPKPVRKGLIITLVSLAVPVLIALGFYISTLDSESTNFYKIQTLCDPAKSRLTVGDDGRTLILNSWGGDSNQEVDANILACTLTALQAPDAVVYQIGQTRTEDAPQKAEWATYKASWISGPTTGVDVVVVR